MTYRLGVDLGTTFSAAAVVTDARATSVGLGNQSHVIPSVVGLDEQNGIIVGESAERQARVDPTASAREFKRRIGDTTPYLIRGTPFSPEALTGHLLHWIVQRVSQIEGEAPSGIRLTHPANWGPYQKDILGEAARLIGLSDISFMSEPEAAAVHYATMERIPDGAVVAIYDLGGGTFDASVLRREGGGFRTLGKPEGIARLGGIDFDEAVFAHVTRSLGDAWHSLDITSSASLAALARLRRDCVAAKEDLSSRSTTSIDALLPGLNAEIRLTRAEFESMITLPIQETIASLERAIASAEITPADIHNVLLVGGSSRVPLVSQMVSAALGRPVALDAHPKYAVSLGAAIALDIERSASHADFSTIDIDQDERADISTAFSDPAGPTAQQRQAEALRVPLAPAAPAPTVLTPTIIEPEPEVLSLEPDPAPTPAPEEPRARVFPSTTLATVFLVLGLLALAALIAWWVLVGPPQGVPVEQFSLGLHSSPPGS